MQPYANDFILKTVRRAIAKRILTDIGKSGPRFWVMPPAFPRGRYLPKLATFSTGRRCVSPTGVRITLSRRTYDTPACGFKIT